MCVEAGADALGFIFAESPRRIETGTAAEIVAKLPAKVETVGVFADETIERITDICRCTHLTALQLHGSEGPGYNEQIAATVQLKIIRAVAAQTFVGSDGVWFERDVLRKLYAILLDSGRNKPNGGSGRSWNWNSSAKQVTLLNRMVNIVVAGGLTSENVGEAIRILCPWGVDVVSGVEREPGKKDPKKVKAFIEAVRRADQEMASR